MARPSMHRASHFSRFSMSFSSIGAPAAERTLQLAKDLVEPALRRDDAEIPQRRGVDLEWMRELR